MSIFKRRKKYILPIDVTPSDLPGVMLKIYKMINLCRSKCITSLSAPLICDYKKYFIFLKKDGTFQLVINPLLKKIGKIISVLEGTSIIEYCKEISVEFYVPENNTLAKVEKTLKDDEAILFQKEYNVISNVVKYKKGC